MNEPGLTEVASSIQPVENPQRPQPESSLMDRLRGLFGRRQEIKQDIADGLGKTALVAEAKIAEPAPDAQPADLEGRENNIEWSAYEAARKELENKQYRAYNPDGKPATLSFQGRFINAPSGVPPYIDEIVSRGLDDLRMITKAVIHPFSNPFSGKDDPTMTSDSAEKTEAYQMSIGYDGEFIINTLDRDLVRRVHDIVLAKYNSNYSDLSNSRDPARETVLWLINDSEFVDQHSPEHPDQDLIS